MTPMIDVVFQLIIFFLVTNHLVKQEEQLQLPLPVAESGRRPVEENIPRLTINVLEDGTLMLAGRTLTAAICAADCGRNCGRSAPVCRCGFAVIAAFPTDSSNRSCWPVPERACGTFPLPCIARRTFPDAPSSPYLKQRSDVNIHMTPLIDVVFLLMVFFVWTAGFQVAEYMLPSQLAPMTGTGRPRPMNHPRPGRGFRQSRRARAVGRGSSGVEDQ